MRHTISILVENKFGVLTRIAGMFSGRGFNIDTTRRPRCGGQRSLCKTAPVLRDHRVNPSYPWTPLRYCKTSTVRSNESLTLGNHHCLGTIGCTENS